MAIGDRIKHAVASTEDSARRAAHSVSETASRLAGNITTDITHELNSVTNAFDLLTGSTVVGASATKYNAETGETTQVPLSPPAVVPSGTRMTDFIAATEARTSSAMHSAVSEVTKIAGDITAPISSFAGDIHTAVNTVADHISDTASDVFSSITSLPSEIGHVISQDAVKAKDTIETGVQTVFTKAQNIKDDITRPFRTLGHDVANDIKYVLLFGGIAALVIWQGTSGVRSDAVSWGRRTAKRTFDQLEEVIPEVASTIPKIALAAPFLL